MVYSRSPQRRNHLVRRWKQIKNTRRLIDTLASVEEADAVAEEDVFEPHCPSYAVCTYPNCLQNEVCLPPAVDTLSATRRRRNLLS